MKKFLKVLTIIILSILIILFAIVIILFIKSKTWERNFQSEMNPHYLVNDSILPEEFDRRVEEYILSKESTDFLTLSPEEVGHTVFGSLAQMVEESVLETTNVYIEPSKGVWKICARARLRDVRNVYAWVCADVTKDDMQTAQIYLKNLEIQGIDIGKIYPGSLIMINQGIAEAVVIANENGFVGRVFENMELLEDELIIKGFLY